MLMKTPKKIRQLAEVTRRKSGSAAHSMRAPTRKHGVYRKFALRLGEIGERRVSIKDEKTVCVSHNHCIYILPSHY